MTDSTHDTSHDAQAQGIRSRYPALAHSDGMDDDERLAALSRTLDALRRELDGVDDAGTGSGSTANDTMKDGTR